MNNVLLMIGSNENAGINISQCLKKLNALFVHPVCVSDVFQSKAVHKDGSCADKPDYSNVLCYGITGSEYTDLNAQLKKLEEDSGRKRGPQANGLVTLDIDIIGWNGANIRPADASQKYFKTCLSDLKSKHPEVKWKKIFQEPE